MGANYIPEDSLLGRRSKERSGKLIKDCVKANFNMLRIWGGGYYPDDDFYDLCDENGIILWQDFMFANAAYDLTDEFKENVTQEAIDNIRRLRHHASLGLWCGNNEIEGAMGLWVFDLEYTPKLKMDYIKLLQVLLPELANTYDPNTFYWYSSPSSGPDLYNPMDQTRGDLHSWGVWHSLGVCKIRGAGAEECGHSFQRQLFRYPDFGGQDCQGAKRRLIQIDDTGRVPERADRPKHV